MPTISVIVPVYKVEAYLPRCLDSILAQTFTDFELWLVNDGSPDSCGEICDEYARRDNRIQVIHKTNGGLSDARNAGLDRATGSYVSFVDSDDWVEKDFLQSMYEALTKNQADLAICNMKAVKENGEETICYQPTTEETVIEGDDIFATLYQPCAQNKLYPAPIFHTLRFPFGRWYEDAFIYHEILAQVQRIVYTGKASYCYLLREGSIMRSSYRLKSTEIVEACHARATKLQELGQYHHANIARLHIYSQLSVAYAMLDKTKTENKARLQELQAIYDSHYQALMKSPENNAKQKLRLWLLHNSPKIHTMIYGRNARQVT